MLKTVASSILVFIHTGWLKLKRLFAKQTKNTTNLFLKINQERVLSFCVIVPDLSVCRKFYSFYL